jgi:cytochrome c peroxidase
MHDGSEATLEAVMELYNRGGNRNPNLDPRMLPLNLTEQEKADLVAFMHALTGRMPEVSPPELPQ